MVKTTYVHKDEALVIENGARLIIGNQSMTVEQIEVTTTDGKKKKIFALVPGAEI